MTINGLSHVSLSVNDLAAARAFWVDVLGFAPRIEQDGLVVLVHPSSPLSLALVAHPDGNRGGFDARQVGLDHLALDVTGLADLESWEKTFGAADLECSPIVETPFGWHLNVKAPDNIAVELLAMRPEAKAMLFG